MNKLSFSLALVSVALLAGCAQFEQRKIEEQSLADAKQIVAMCSFASRSPALSSISEKIPVDARRATVAQLGDPSYASPEQVVALGKYEDIFSDCLREQDAYSYRYGAPGVGVIYAQSRQQSKLLMADLWARKITFGQFNTARMGADGLARQRADGAVQSFSQQQQRDDMQRRQNAAMAVQQYQMQQAQQPEPQPYMMPIPQTTTCNRYGNQVNCTTR